MSAEKKTVEKTKKEIESSLLPVSESSEPGESEYQVGCEFYKKRQFTEAFESFEQSAQKKYPLSYVCLWRLCRRNDTAILRDKKKQAIYSNEMAKQENIDWFHEKANKGNVDVQFNLGYCYEISFGVQKNLVKAVMYYQLAADRGDARAQCSLGSCYEHGKGVPQDFAKAAENYQLAADQGERNGQVKLGWFYTEGLGVPQDFVKAAKNYQLAADQGERIAQFNLGLFYEKGYGVGENLIQAIHYFQLAAKQGLVEAEGKLNQCCERIEYYEKIVAKLKQVQQEKENGNSEAQETTITNNQEKSLYSRPIFQPDSTARENRSKRKLREGIEGTENQKKKQRRTSQFLV